MSSYCNSEWKNERIEATSKKVGAVKRNHWDDAVRVFSLCERLVFRQAQQCFRAPERLQANWLVWIIHRRQTLRLRTHLVSGAFTGGISVSSAAVWSAVTTLTDLKRLTLHEGTRAQHTGQGAGRGCIKDSFGFSTGVIDVSQSLGVNDLVTE